MIDAQSSTAPNGELKLVPLGWGNVVKALFIATRSFGSEVMIIALCYLWALTSRAGLRLNHLVLRRKLFDVMEKNRVLAEFELLTSPLYGKDVCWVRVSYEEDIDPVRLIAALMQKTAKFRLAVFRLDEFDRLPEHWPQLEPHGTVAGFAVYSLRNTSDSQYDPSAAFGTTPRKAIGDVKAEFFLVERDREMIGLTGTYSVDFWPGMVWGGWGALTKSAGYRGAALETLRITEALVRDQNAGMFCLDTSDGAKYRAARKIYELYGLDLLLEIPDFYSDGEAFMVFGKQITSGESVKHA